VGAVPPLMLRTATNPEGTPLEVFDGIREGTAWNRSQFFYDLTMPFYGFNRDGAAVNDGLRESFREQGLMGSIKGHYDCVHEFSEVDYTDDLKKMDVPTLIVHGDDDQIVPIAASALKSAKIVRDATLLVYNGGQHGLAQIDHAKFNADVLAFIRG
jgi:non-heme chloroperoxidase